MTLATAFNKKKIFFILLLSILCCNIFAESNDEQNLLQDIKVQINSDDQLKIQFIFEKNKTIPKIDINKKDSALNIDFINSYIKLDKNSIEINHKLLKGISFDANKNKLTVICLATPTTLFTLEQDNNSYTLNLMAKDKLTEIMASENSISLNKKDTGSTDDVSTSTALMADQSNESEAKSENLSADIVNSQPEQKLKNNNQDSELSKNPDKPDEKVIEEKINEIASQEKNIDKEKIESKKEQKTDDKVAIKPKRQIMPKSVQSTDIKNHKKIKSDAINKVKSKLDSIFSSSKSNITSFDFKLSEQKLGRLVINFANKNVVKITDKSDESGSNIIQLKFKNASMPSSLINKYDVKDFGTVVNAIEWIQDRKSNGIILNVYNKSKADYVAFQKGTSLIIEIKDGKEVSGSVFNKTYTGKKISLNFQNIELRSVLQIIADFTNLNLVASDNIQGNISLRLMSVPWDQALDIILKTKSLDKRQFGNILMVAPTNEIFELERSELEAEQLLEKLSKLETEYFPINYAKAEDVAQLISGKNKILSQRGTASFDKRTNLLIIQDTSTKLKEIRQVLKKLDSPVKQVLIEARIVKADTNFRKELGIRWGLSAKRTSNNYKIGIGDTSPNATQVLTDGTVVSPKKQADVSDAAGDTGFNIDLGLASPTSIIGLALAKLPGETLVHLELSALESEGLVETVSSPKLMTANKVPARIEQGTEIPYQEATSSGATNIAFKKAVLSLLVTPQVTPDNKIILDLNVTNDTPNFSNTVSNGVPVIDTQEVETQVLVDDGQTIVLGGIFTQETNNSVERVPFLGDLPIIGQLFRKNVTQDDRSEFLIFITPKVVIDKA